MDDEVTLAIFIRGIYAGIVLVSSINSNVCRTGNFYVIGPCVSVQDCAVIAAGVYHDVIAIAAVERNRNLDVGCYSDLVVATAEIAVNGADTLEDVSASHGRDLQNRIILVSGKLLNQIRLVRRLSAAYVAEYTSCAHVQVERLRTHHIQLFGQPPLLRARLLAAHINGLGQLEITHRKACGLRYFDKEYLYPDRNAHLDLCAPVALGMEAEAQSQSGKRNAEHTRLDRGAAAEVEYIVRIADVVVSDLGLYMEVKFTDQSKR